MVFIETPTFTRMITEIINDEEYLGYRISYRRILKEAISSRAGGGLRKIRYALQGRGKAEALG